MVHFILRNLFKKLKFCEKMKLFKKCGCFGTKRPEQLENIKKKIFRWHNFFHTKYLHSLYLIKDGLNHQSIWVIFS